MYVGDEGGKKLKMALACLLDQDGLLRREPDIVSPVYWLQSRDAVTELLYGFEWLTIQGTRAPFITIFAMKCIPERFGRQCAARNGPLPEDNHQKQVSPRSRLLLFDNSFSGTGAIPRSSAPARY
jgi:hypothetical protein